MIYTVTFSPSGGTQRVADCIAMGFDQPYLCIDLCVSEWKMPEISFTKEDICIAAMPAYGGRVPALAAKRLSELQGNGAKAVAVAVFGNRAIDDTLLETRDLLEAAGFNCVAGIEAVAEHSIVRKFAAGRPDVDDAQELMGFARKIAAAIQTGAISEKPALPGNFPYKEWGGSGMKPEILPGCNRCGICAARCPSGAIPKDDPSGTDFSKCMSCMQCIAACPLSARRLDPDMIAAVAEKMDAICTGRKENRLYM